MGRAVNFIYGGILILLVLVLMLAEDSAFGIPNFFLWGLVATMGVLILFTRISDRAPIMRGGMVGTLPARPRFQWLRRWVFGAFILISGLLPFLQTYMSFSWIAQLSVETFSGQVIVLVIGVIYFLGAFERTRQIQIASV